MNFDRDQSLLCARLVRELYDGTTKPNVVHRGTDTQALIYRGDSHQPVYVIFPGTASMRDWCTDLNIRKVGWHHGSVHRGFRLALESVLSDLLALLNPEDRIVVAGHSLGGALAMLAAHALHEQGERIAAVYTFGQPRVGNWAFKLHYDANLHDETFRIVNAGDPVPHIPWVFGTYKHAGTEVYLHHQRADEPVEATVDSPLWTAALEVKQTFEQIKQRDPHRCDFNIPHHSIHRYIEKLEVLG